MDFWAKSIDFLLSTFYPQKCIGCGRTIKYDEQLCELCEHFIERVDSSKRCLVCGFERSRCRCKKSIFRYSGVVSPFYNTGIARRGFYAYKLGGHENYAEFFAQNMCGCVKEEFNGVKFHAVCCVPPSKKRMKRYGFNPSEQLGVYVAEKLKIPFVKDALISLGGTSSQHKLTKAERFAYIQGKYIPNKRLDGKTVLLVDDILSTGATLNECTRQLMLAGAHDVKCVTALITDNGKKTDIEYAKTVYRKYGKRIEKQQGEDDGN